MVDVRAARDLCQFPDVGALARVVEAVEQRRVEDHGEAARLPRRGARDGRGREVEPRRADELRGPARVLDGGAEDVARPAPRLRERALGDVEAHDLVAPRREPVRVVARAAARVEDGARARVAEVAALEGVAHRGLPAGEETKRSGDVANRPGEPRRLMLRTDRLPSARDGE